MTRAILHADLDAFYASVEQRDDPGLRGRPVAVAGRPPRGVVLAASYEARRDGVRSAMPTARALALCPSLHLCRPRMERYARESRRFFAILAGYTPCVEALSLDEAFLDVTASRALHGDGPAIARALKQRVRAELDLVVSVGVAPTKFVAKIASAAGKPDGLLVVEEDRVADFLAPLPIGRMWGVGEVTERALHLAGLHRIGDLATAGETALAAVVGAERARNFVALATGDDPREVVADRAAVSVGSESTFEGDLFDRAALRPYLLDQVDVACARLRRLGARARTIAVKVKYADHRLVSRRTTLDAATADQRLVGQHACRLLEAVPRIEQRGVRLTGISLSGLEALPRQLSIDGGAAPSGAADDAAEGGRGERLSATLDRIAGRFGPDALRRADSPRRGAGTAGLLGDDADAPGSAAGEPRGDAADGHLPLQGRPGR